MRQLKLTVLGAALLVASPMNAQNWDSARVRELVSRATMRRAEQLADSGLADYSASARGYLTFLAQFGAGFALPPKVVKADEIALEVYWRAPNVSKQWILGRRDTLVLPTDIQYHRDHLGIVQNNFPNIIRLGDGDEVRDVPHPLSQPGLTVYEFAITDSLRFQIPGRSIDVYEVKVRPRNQGEAAAVGALYIAREDAQVVRMAFSFTRSALKDKQLEDVSIILENSLIQERFWLPRRQEIEIRRSGSWMDFPARGIIRGRWEIGNYNINTGSMVALAPGPEIVPAPPQRRAAYRFPETAILDSLPEDVRLASMDEVRRVQEEARTLVRAQALARARQTRPSARSFSQVLQVNRAEGLAAGLGIRHQFGAGVDAGLSLRYGFSDHEAKGTLSLGIESAAGRELRARIFREYTQAGDEKETSGIRNSIAAQEFGSDYTQPFDSRGASLAFTVTPPSSPWRWSAEASLQDHDSLRVTAKPARGSFKPLISATPGRLQQLGVGLESPTRELSANTTLALSARASVGRFSPDADTQSPSGHSTIVRFYAAGEATRKLGQRSVVGRATLGAVEASKALPQQFLLRAGGPFTAPGYEYHRFASDRMATAHLELHTPIPFVSLPLGRWGRTPARATLVPFAGTVLQTSHGANTEGGGFPYAGLGTLLFFDVIRLDIARGIRDGRWRFGVDVVRDFWPIL